MLENDRFWQKDFFHVCWRDSTYSRCLCFLLALILSRKGLINKACVLNEAPAFLGNNVLGIVIGDCGDIGAKTISLCDRGIEPTELLVSQIVEASNLKIQKQSIKLMSVSVSDFLVSLFPQLPAPRKNFVSVYPELIFDWKRKNFKGVWLKSFALSQSSPIFLARMFACKTLYEIQRKQLGLDLDKQWSSRLSGLEWNERYWHEIKAL